MSVHLSFLLLILLLFVLFIIDFNVNLLSLYLNDSTETVLS